MTNLHSTLINRSGSTILCSNQRRYNTVQTHHGGRSRVLELPGCARCTSRALDFTRLLPEEAAAETRVEPVTSPQQLICWLIPTSPLPRLRNMQRSLKLLRIRLVGGGGIAKHSSTTKMHAVVGCSWCQVQTVHCLQKLFLVSVTHGINIRNCFFVVFI